MIFCALVITFNPNILNLKNLIQKLSEQNCEAIIVDNNSENVAEIFEIKNKMVSIISLESNFGIAYAQNVGIKEIILRKFQYVIFFDQDSQIDKNYIDKMSYDYLNLSKKEAKIGLLGPKFIDDRYGFYYKTVNMNKFGIREKIDVSNIDQPFHSALLISSGSLVSVDTFTKIGFMRENYFIDYVDTEWCIRAESMGYKNFISSSATMVHAIGDNVLQFKYFNVPVHSAFRRYYRVRNAYYMLREPHVPILLALREILFNFIHQIFLIVFEDDKKGYIKSYIRGCIDGIFKYEKNNDN